MVDPPEPEPSGDEGGETDRAGAGLDDLERWLADIRVDEVASARSREHWLRRQLEEEATLAGILLDMAERGAPVLIATASGRRHHGIVRAVAEDFCAIRSSTGVDIVVANVAITSVRPGAGLEITFAGSRPGSLSMALADALAALVGERHRVQVIGSDGSRTAGELRSVGADVVVVRLDGSAGVAYIPVTAIAEIVIDP